MKKLIVALLGFAAIALPQSAIAQYNSPHKYTDAFGKTKVFLPGTANTQTEYTSVAFKNLTATYNRCGRAKIPMGATGDPTSISTESNLLTFLPIQKPPNFLSDPECFLGNTSTWYTREPTASGNMSNSVLPTSNGLALPGYSFFYNFTLFVKLRYGLANPSALPIKITYNRSFKLNINNCGFGTVRVSTARPMTNFKFANIDYTLANLPEVTKPIICRTQGTSKIRYVPLIP